jgi:hypothetical protein
LAGVVFDPEVVFRAGRLRAQELLPIADCIQKTGELAPVREQFMTNPRFRTPQNARAEQDDQLAAAVATKFPEVAARRNISPPRRESSHVTRFRGRLKTPRREGLEEAPALPCLLTTPLTSYRVDEAPGDEQIYMFL